MVLAKKFIYAKRFEGEPTASNFRLETEELGPLKDNEILCEAAFLSVDPYMRPYMSRHPENSLMIGGQVAKDIPGSSEGTSRIIAALPATYTIAAGASTTVMKLDDTNQFSMLDDKDEKNTSNDLNCSKSGEVNADQQCLVDHPNQQNHQESIVSKDEKAHNGAKKENHTEKSKDGINSIESMNERKLNNSTFDIADSSLYVNKYSGKKKKNKKKKKKDSHNNDDAVESDPDAKIVKCLYYTLMCCECTIS